MNVIFKLFCAALAAFLLLFNNVSCVSAPKSEKSKKSDFPTAYLKLVENGNYDAAHEILSLRNTDKKGNIISSKDYLRDLFDSAMLCHLMEDFETSAERFEKADSMMADFFDKTVNPENGDLLLLDANKPYAGRSYEWVFINGINALNFCRLGDFKRAYGELKKYDNRKKDILAKYGEFALQENEKIQHENKLKLESAAKMMGINLDVFESPAKPLKIDVYCASAFVEYMNALLALSLGNKENAIIAVQRLSELNKKIDMREDFAVEKSGNGRINIVALADFVARCNELRISSVELCLAKGIYGGSEVEIPDIGKIIIPEFDIEIAYPIVFKQDYKYEPFYYSVPISYSRNYSIRPVKKPVVPAALENVSAVKIYVDGKSFELSMLENYSLAAENDAELFARKIYEKNLLESVLKKNACVMAAASFLAIPQKIYKQTGITFGYDGAFIGLSKALDGIDSTINADIRQAYVLPGEIYAGGITVRPGEYDIKIVFLDADGNAVHMLNFYDIKVDAGKPTIVEAICMGR